MKNSEFSSSHIGTDMNYIIYVSLFYISDRRKHMREETLKALVDRDSILLAAFYR